MLLENREQSPNVDENKSLVVKSCQFESILEKYGFISLIGLEKIHGDKVWKDIDFLMKTLKPFGGINNLNVDLERINDCFSDPNWQEDSEHDDSEDNQERIDIILKSDVTYQLYLNEFQDSRILTKGGQREMFLRYKVGIMAFMKISDLSFENNDNRDYRKDLIKLSEIGDFAKDVLIKSCHRLVINIAKKYIGKGVPFLDLMQAGNVGLIRSMGKFDPNHEDQTKFSTYATWWIRQAIGREVEDCGRAVRVPVHMHNKFSKLAKMKSQLLQEYDREPSVEELADKLGLSVSKVLKQLEYFQLPISLDKPVFRETNDDDELTLGQIILSQDPAVEEIGDMNLIKEVLMRLLDDLPRRERKILELRFGIDGDEEGGDGETLKEVADKYEVTRERIRQIQSKAEGKLRNSKSFRK